MTEAYANFSSSRCRLGGSKASPRGWVRLGHRDSRGLPASPRCCPPGLESSPFHALWPAQFHGASGLFSALPRDIDEARLAAPLDEFRLFRLGASWGGVQSLMAPIVLDRERSADRTYAGRPIVRLSIGLEEEEHLLADLLRCFGPVS